MSHVSIEFTEEEQIYSCLNLENPKSFFLFAGAGSGKTRTLTQVLKKFKNENCDKLKNNGQKVAIITYTNAASDEIKRRLEFHPTFAVSTIHSFSWELIKPYQHDIKEWLRKSLVTEITDLEEQQRKGRSGTKASIDRAAKIEYKQKRLDSLDSIKKISYNPNGVNNSLDFLNHAEILKITSNFLLNKPLMQKILVKKFPILLIDESQDTNKELIEAFFDVQKKYPNNFSLGLFGDTMQRIYTDGKADLGYNIPDSWEKPKKTINYRSPPRIIKLINDIRHGVDDQKQEPFKKEEGFVRLFIVNSNFNLDKSKVESRIGEWMVKITSDEKWQFIDKEVKILTLEHHMAAKRGGFIDFFEPLYRSNSNPTGILDGSMPEISFLVKQLLPLIKASRRNDQFEVAHIMKSFSPLLDKNKMKESKHSLESVKIADSAIKELMTLWGDSFHQQPDLLTLLKRVSELDILTLPENLSLIVNRRDVEIAKVDPQDKSDKLIDGWDEALKASFYQLEQYADYISDNSPFGTHQGVKGLEFPRVMVILDDEEARGFLFSYEKLLGAKELSETDHKNISEGKETSVDRTRRLFYVTCSRAEESLAIVAYTKNPESIKNYATSKFWFNDDEIVRIDNEI